MSNITNPGNLVEVIQALFNDPATAGAFQKNPQEFINEHGMENATYEQINEAVILACDGPVSQGAVVGGSSFQSTINQQVSPVGVSAPAAPAHSAPATPPPPPPAPPAEMPQSQAVEQIVSYYVTEVHETTNLYETNNVDDRDTFTDNSVSNNVQAGDNAHVDITNDNDTVTASGDGAVAGGENSDFEGVATGDGAVAAGDDIEGNVNTGTNTGVIGDNADIDDSIFGDGNTQVNDTSGTAVVGDDNVTATDGSQAAGRDLMDNDTEINTDIDNSGSLDMDGSNIGGVGNTAVQDNDEDNDTFTQDIDTTLTDQSITDQSVTDQSTNDSFNTDDSFNQEQSLTETITAEESFNAEVVEPEPDDGFDPV